MQPRTQKEPPKKRSTQKEPNGPKRESKWQALAANWLPNATKRLNRGGGCLLEMKFRFRVGALDAVGASRNWNSDSGKGLWAWEASRWAICNLA